MSGGPSARLVALLPTGAAPFPRARREPCRRLRRRPVRIVLIGELCGFQAARASCLAGDALGDAIHDRRARSCRRTAGDCRGENPERPGRKA
jgi:hypothetical protein